MCVVRSQENGIWQFFFLEKNYLKFEWEISVSSKDFFSVEKDDRPFAYSFEFLELFSMQCGCRSSFEVVSTNHTLKNTDTHTHKAGQVVPFIYFRAKTSFHIHRRRKKVYSSKIKLLNWMTCVLEIGDDIYLFIYDTFSQTMMWIIAQQCMNAWTWIFLVT